MENKNQIVFVVVGNGEKHIHIIIFPHLGGNSVRCVIWPSIKQINIESILYNDFLQFLNSSETIKDYSKFTRWIKLL